MKIKKQLTAYVLASFLSVGVSFILTSCDGGTSSGSSYYNENDYKKKVENSAYDGSVHQVEDYLKSHLKDADSYQSVEWGNVVDVKGNYQVRHKYRAKNSFGGYLLLNQVFVINHDGDVIEVIAIEL